MKTRSVLVLAVAAATVACGQESEGPTGPETIAAYSVEASYEAARFAVYPFQLRPDEGSGSAAWGEMVVRIGTGLPPRSCRSDGVLKRGQVGMSFCGVLHNPAGETLEDAAFLLAATGPDGGVFPVRASFEHPPSPCRTVVFTGSLDLVAYPNPGPPGIGYPNPGPPDIGYPSPGPPTIVELTLNTDAGLLIGYPSPGPPNIGYPDPGPPTDRADVRHRPGPVRGVSKHRSAGHSRSRSIPGTCEIGIVRVTRG